MRLDRVGIALSLALVTLFAPVCAHAQWGQNGIPVSALNGNQHTPVSAPDGAGGVFLAWFDDRGPYGRQIYAQHLNASGVPAWTTDGIPIRVAPGTNWSLAIVADGQGGAILAWYTAPLADDDIFAQRLDAAGNTLWASNGMVVCGAEGGQVDPELVPDGSGGAIIVWQDQRDGFAGDVYAQRVSAAGATQWDPDGVPLCVAADEQLNMAVVACGAGSAIVAWEDFRDTPYVKIYAQLVNSSGVVQWTPNGMRVCPAPLDQSEPAIVEDGANGAVLVWSDRRGDTTAVIYAQRLSNSGTALWDSSGVALGAPKADAASPCAVSDGAGGAIVAWSALIANGNQFHVQAQRVSASGALLYDPLGMRLTNAPGSENHARIASDGAGGAVVAWTDSRPSTSSPDIYAQRVDAAGVLKWEAGGRAVCTAASAQNTQTIASGPPGSAIVAWSDFRSNGGYDVYAQSPSTTVVSVGWELPVTGRVGTLRPNPARAGAALDFALTKSQRVSIEVFDVGGRVVRRIVKGQTFAAGSQTVFWDGTGDRGVPAPAGVYGIRVSGSDFSVTRRVAIVR